MKPSDKSALPAAGAELRDVATQWVVRQDRRLTAEEAAQLDAWLAADPRHAAAFEQAARSWKFFRELGGAVRRAPEPAPCARPRRRWPAAAGLAAAASVAVALWLGSQPRHAVDSPLAVEMHAEASSPGAQRLADGSEARLKGGAHLIQAFTAAERRVRVERGEVFFTVTKDAARPFLVEVGPVTVRAVGTAFAVRFEPQSVDVLVTEGSVEVLESTTARTVSPLIEAGHRAVVPRVAPERLQAAVTITAVTPEQITRELAWSEPMLELAGATLGEVVAELSRRSGRRIEIGDPQLESVRIGGRFPVHDIEGFTRALEAVYDVSAQRREDGTVVLRAR